MKLRHPVAADRRRERLIAAAEQLRREAEKLPPSRQEKLLRQARRNEVSARLDRWLSSPDLKAPK